MTDVLESMQEAGAPRAFFFSDRPSGLRAILVIDDLTLGPAAGGVRTRAYATEADALAEAMSLARAMTIKCALAGLAAGGGKAVVLDHAALDRPRAFEILGARIEELGGAFRTAGDLGTGPSDLAAMARHTRYVHTDRALADAVARGLVRCIEACAAAKGVEVRGLRVGVQGAGAIGSAAARALAAAGADVLVSDVDAARAEACARESGARVLAPEAIVEADLDVLAPCAIGGVITEETAARVRAWAVCGAANDIVAGRGATDALRARGILHVPDPVASAGAVIEGIGRTVMGLPDRTPLIDALGVTAAEVLRRAREEGRTETEIAHAMARARIAGAGRG